MYKTGSKQPLIPQTLLSIVVCSGPAFSVGMGEPLCLGMCPDVTDLRLHKEPGQG